MKKARQITSRLGLGLLVTGIGVFGQPANRPVAEQALTSLPTKRVFVHAIAKLPKAVTGVDSIDWSGVSNRMLIGVQRPSGFYNVCTMTPAGMLVKSRVLEHPNGARVHSGSPSWHPNGKFFVFSCQKQHAQSRDHAVPRIGWHTDMWLADKEGNSFWQLTNESSTRRAPKGVTNPSFSPDGTKVFWSGNNGKTSRSPWQQKALFIGDFGQEGGKPKLTNIRNTQPGENQDFYEAYGFSPDGNRIMFAANMARGNPWYGMDIYVSSRGEAPVSLTRSPGVWDRFATYSPDGKRIVWTSNKGMRIGHLGSGGAKWQRHLRSELWIMDADGKHGKKLTFFNQPGHAHFQGRRVFLGDSAFSPDGKHVAVVMYKEGQNFEPKSEIVMLKLGIGPPPRVVSQPPGGGEKPTATKTEPEAPKTPAPKDGKGKPKFTTW